VHDDWIKVKLEEFAANVMAVRASLKQNEQAQLLIRKARADGISTVKP